MGRSDDLPAATELLQRKGATSTGWSRGECRLRHFLDHAVHRDALDAVAGIVGEQVKTAGDIAEGCHVVHGVDADVVAGFQFARGDARDAVPGRKVDCGTVGEGDGKMASLSGIFLVLVNLLHGHRFAAIANDQIATLDLLDWNRSVRGINRGSLREAAEPHFGEDQSASRDEDAGGEKSEEERELQLS